MKTNTSRKAGFTLVEIMIVVAIIGLLAAIAIPNFVRARSTSQKNACINNLRQINGAIQQWALEKNKATNADVVVAELAPYLKGSLICPAGGTSWTDSYSVSTVSVLPQCLLNGTNAGTKDHVLTADILPQ